MPAVRILGAGPAGCAAALGALAHGSPVELFEKSPFPRHKVCGEFLSPEAIPLLDRLGVRIGEDAVHITRMMLSFGGREKHALLPEPALGLSRYALDQMMLDSAVGRGAVLHREKGNVESCAVIAAGRNGSAPRGRRLFAFKAHFSGPCNDSVELYFTRRRTYLGINRVEGGLTNVCGITEECALREVGFDIDEFLHRDPILRGRLAPMQRCWKWLTVGPLLFEDAMHGVAKPLYLAGDALGFVDPFTGSGILSALHTGSLAGRSAAIGQSTREYYADCRRALRRPFLVASLFRRALDQGWGQWLAPWIPSSWLFRLTRPNAR